MYTAPNIFIAFPDRSKQQFASMGQREGVNKSILYGQADRKRLPPTPPYSHLFVNLFGVFFIQPADEARGPLQSMFST